MLSIIGSLLLMMLLLLYACVMLGYAHCATRVVQTVTTSYSPQYSGALLLIENILYSDKFVVNFHKSIMIYVHPLLCFFQFQVNHLCVVLVLLLYNCNLV